MSRWIRCNICGFDDTRHLFAIDSGSVVRCRNCGLAYQNPRPDQLTDYEEDFFLREYRDFYGVDYVEDRENIARIARRRLDAIQRLVQGGRILDVGCATGFFLHEARCRGLEPWGVEISGFAVKHAREKLRLNVCHGPLESAGFSSGFFDIVTLWYVLEHVDDPSGLMKEVRRVLRPGGVLGVAVPNLRSLYRLLLRRQWMEERRKQRHHLYDFEPRTLRALLEKSGLTVYRINSEGKMARSLISRMVVGGMGLGNVLVAFARACEPS
ncbi:MAG: methyltransferase domain-containing protein [Deltaproteobacteria bacterium]|nr:methyltransferase domain-containing protein [Deltaproteobacteria bacterium]